MAAFRVSFLLSGHWMSFQRLAFFFFLFPQSGRKDTNNNRPVIEEIEKKKEIGGQEIFPGTRQFGA